MAAFAKSSFNAQLYSASRPTYPRQLFEYIFRYHEFGGISDTKGTRSKPRTWDRAVDLGCGTGQATIDLLPFGSIIGVDPSKKMTETARKYVREELKRQGRSNMKSNFSFTVGSAEELPFLNKNSVDLVVAAQAAHWFTWNKLWPELARVLRSGGTVAVWGYSEMRFTRCPSLTPLIDAYTHGPDPETSLGPHWQQPGRSIVENLLQDIPSAESIVEDEFYAERRIYFSGSHFPSIRDARPVVLRKKMSWDSFEAYLRSFSALSTFQAKYKKDAKHPDGDIVARFIKTIKAGMRDADIPTAEPGRAEGVEEANKADPGEVEIEWPLVLILAKKA